MNENKVLLNEIGGHVDVNHNITHNDSEPVKVIKISKALNMEN